MKNFRGNKNNIVIGLCAILILMGIGFAAFSQRLQIGDTTTTNSDWNVYIKSAVAGTPVGDATGSAQVIDRATAKLTANLSSPGDSVTYTITVANDGNIDAVLDLITLSASNNDSVIKYSYSGIEEDEELLAETEKSFTVTIAYDNTKTGTVTEEQKQNTLTLDLDFVQKTKELDVTPIQTFTTSDLKNKAVTNGDGLYIDTYEEGRYVYKGADPANYMTFNGEEAGWKIMSIEADGTLKIIRHPYALATVFDSTGLRDASSGGAGGTYCYDEGSNYSGCSVWAATENLVGTPAEFTDRWDSGTVLKDSELNTFLNKTYYINKLDTTYVIEHDFGVGAVTWNNADLADQIDEEKYYIWNGMIGLMNLSDYIRANSNITECGTFALYNTNANTCKSTNYLYSDGQSWTINPNGSSSVYIIDWGDIYYDGPYPNNNDVFPVVYLSSSITLSGSGTNIDPYEIVS